MNAVEAAGRVEHRRRARRRPDRSPAARRAGRPRGCGSRCPRSTRRVKSPQRAVGRQLAQHRRRSTRRPCRSGAAGRRGPSSFAAARVRGADEVAEAQQRRPVDRFGERHAGQQRQQPRHVDLVRDVAAIDQIVEAGGRSAPCARPSRTASAPSGDRRSAGRGSRAGTRRTPLLAITQKSSP